MSCGGVPGALVGSTEELFPPPPFSRPHGYVARQGSHNIFRAYVDTLVQIGELSSPGMD